MFLSSLLATGLLFSSENSDKFFSSFSPFCLLDWFKISWALARPESSKCDPTIFRGNGQDDEIENWLIYLRVESILTLLFSENIFGKSWRTLNFDLLKIISSLPPSLFITFLLCVLMII